MLPLTSVHGVTPTHLSIFFPIILVRLFFFLILSSSSWFRSVRISRFFSVRRARGHSSPCTLDRRRASKPRVFLSEVWSWPFWTYVPSSFFVFFFPLGAISSVFVTKRRCFGRTCSLSPPSNPSNWRSSSTMGTLITSGILILTVEFVKAGTFLGSYVHKLEFESFAFLVFSDSFQEYGLNSMTCVLDFS